MYCARGEKFGENYLHVNQYYRRGWNVDIKKKTQLKSQF